MVVSAAIMHDLQMMQDAFAKQLKLAMVITDSDGNYITKPSLSVKQNAHFEKQILSEFVSRFSNFEDNEVTFIADTPYTPIQGLKYILSTMVLHNNIFILWAGPLLTKGMKEISTHHLTPDQKYYQEYIQMMSETSPAELVNLIQNVGEIKQLLRKNIDYDDKHHQFIQQFHLIENLFSQFHIEHFSHLFHETARLFLENNNEMSFIGYTERIDPFQHRIKEAFGTYNELLLTEEFLVGEGFLGQAASSGQFMVWNNIKCDARAFKFSMDDQSLQSLFCLPLKNGNQVDKMIFGGSYQKGIDDVLTGLLRIMHSMLRYYENHSQLKQELSVAQTRLNILKDISVILSDIKDMNRVLYLLMDISINLVKGRFTCIFLNHSQYIEQSKMISRGLSAENISAYGDYLKKKYFGKEKFIPKESVMAAAPGLETAFECPLKQGDEIIGVFCVEISGKQAYEEFSPILTSFVRMCSFAYQQLIREEMKIIDDEKIKILYHATENFNLSAYKNIAEAKSILLEFIPFLQLNDKIRDLCIQALFLSSYRAEFLSKQNISKKIVQIVDDFYLLTENGQKESVSKESQIIYIVMTYLHHQPNKKTVYPDMLDLSLIDMFDAFLLKTNAQETIISDERAPLTIHPDLKKLKNQFHLSEREEEVLDLIIKGTNNKEIGDTLFISEHTVKNHLTNIFRKLDVKDRTQAIAKCYSIGYQYIQ